MPLGDSFSVRPHGQVAVGTFGPFAIAHGGGIQAESVSVAPMDIPSAGILFASILKTSANSVSALGILGTAPADSPFITAHPPTVFLAQATNVWAGFMGAFSMPIGGAARFFGVSLQNNDGGNDGTFTLEINVILVPAFEQTLGSGPPWY